MNPRPQDYQTMAITPDHLVRRSEVIYDLDIPLVSQCRYLGITISETNCGHDINRQMKIMYSNANILLRRFSK